MSAPTKQRISYSFAKDKGLVLFEDEGSTVLGMRPGTDPIAVLEATRVAGEMVDIRTLEANQFERVLSEVYASDGVDSTELDDSIEETDDLSSIAAGLHQTSDLLDTTNDAPVIRLINGLIAEAVRTKASDIHIEPYEDRLSVRLRVDGVMREVLSPSRKVTPLLVSRIKVMARLDIAEKRIPQDGRVSLTLGRRAIDVRVSTLPSRFGERVVMRLLDKEAARLNLYDLGMPAEILSRFTEALKVPNGIILVTGPTGSGKTTTLYAGLSLLNDNSQNILTVEDPIEYGLDGVGQTQVNSKVGMTFAAGLRAILRQDPDIVMVGEIRDSETAEIAVQASLTGHRVLSTVHTNSAAAAITRLRDMGIEPFLLSSTLTAILAQRLVRRLCEACKVPHVPEQLELEQLGIAVSDTNRFFKASGCPSCSHTGFVGRLGVYEIIVLDTVLRKMIHEDAREMEIASHAFTNAPTLLKSGAEHVIHGLTTAEEVLRVVRQNGGADGSL